MPHPAVLVALAGVCGACVPLARAQPTVLPEQRLDPSQTEPGDRFGHAADISGDRAVFSAKYADKDPVTTQDSGLVFVYLRDANGVWTEEAAFAGTDSRDGDVFGFDVAIDGDAILAGAYFDDITTLGTDNAGAAYVFRRLDPGGWTQEAKLLPPVRVANENLGSAVALLGDVALVGGPAGPIVPPVAGGVHVFDRTGPATWTHRTKLVASDAAPADLFGFAIAISGDLAVVGAPGAASGAGAAYVFRRDGNGDWLEVEKIDPVLGSPGERFGSAVDVDGARIIVGATHAGFGGAGAAHLFSEGRADDWAIETTLIGDAAAAGDALGIGVALEGDLALVGATEYVVFGTGDTGVVYAFVRAESGDWEQAGAIRPSDGQSNDQFAACLAVDDRRLAAGSPTSNALAFGSGGAYVIDGHRLVCPADINLDGVVNTADLGILLSSFATTNAAIDVNGDGIINTADLGILVGAFGTFCP